MHSGDLQKPPLLKRNPWVAAWLLTDSYVLQVDPEIFTDQEFNTRHRGHSTSSVCGDLQSTLFLAGKGCDLRRLFRISCNKGKYGALRLAKTVT